MRKKEKLCNQIANLSHNDIPGLLSIIPPEGEDGDGELEIDFDKLDDYTLLKVREYVSKCDIPNDTVPKTGPFDENSKLAIAEHRTNNRLNDLRKQIEGVEKSKSLNRHMTVVINPHPEDIRDDLGFWLARIVQNPVGGEIKVQWFEFKSDDKENEDVKYFELSNLFDTISVHSVYVGLNVRLEYNEEKKCYILNDFKRIKEDIQRLF